MADTFSQPRRRKAPKLHTDTPPSASSNDSLPPTPPSPAPPEASPSPWRLISPLDILRFLGGIVLLSTALSYFITSTPFWGPRPLFTRPAYVLARLRGPLRLTPASLALHNGTDPSRPLYLALNAHIYDVSASPHFYGPGAQYHVFAGRDATRAFVTGCFAEDRTPDLRGAEAVFVDVKWDREPAAWRDGEAGRGERRAWKVGRERAWREARAQARRAVEGWEGLFSGRDKGWRGKYWWVGRVVEDAEGKEGPVRELCAGAKARRPGMQERSEGQGG